MSTTEFLRRVWPTRGLYVIARLTGKGWRHQVCDSIEEAAAYALSFDQSAVPTYFACAAFRDREVVTVKPNGEEWRQVRVAKNVRAVRAFWMDLDVEAGNEEKYQSQTEAIEGLCAFLQKTGLPQPLVVNSGTGIHIYWTLTDEIQPEQWKATADALKQLAAAHEFKSDPACTSDSARVLRPVGTWNRKDPAFPRPVELIAEAAPVVYHEFDAHIRAQCAALGLKAHEAVRNPVATTEKMNQAFEVKHNFPPCNGKQVAERCTQMRVMRDTRGNIAEPHWYAGIQLLCHSVEGDTLIHEWSAGHPRYSVDETNRKIAQVRSQNIGPTLCKTFAAQNPGGCEGCPFKDKLSSPAQLGTVIAAAPAPTLQVERSDGEVEVIRLPDPPPPFTRGQGGGVYIEEDGIHHKILEHDLFPLEIARDEQLGYETTRWRHFMPRDGWKEFNIRSALIARPVDFESALRDNSVRPLIRSKVAMYGDAYIRHLSKEREMNQLFQSQGWKKEDTEFVLADKLYRKGAVVQAGYSQGAASFLKFFRAQGSLDKWRDLTWALDRPGFEPHAFMMLLAFAAPLLRIANRQGFTVNALGPSGAGKSTMAMFMSSVYGHPDKSWITREDTALARMQRLGAHYCLPVYMDEATTIDKKELRDLVYAVPVGKSRAGMTKDGITLRAQAEWCTVFVTSSNDSLQAKLQAEKQNAEAESLRVFEYRFPRVPEFGSIAAFIYKVIFEHYGVAGPAFIRRLIEEQDRIKSEAREVVAATEHEFGMQGKERFWSQAVAMTLYGGRLAREWGIIDFDPERLRPWLRVETQRMRGVLSDNMIGDIAILGQYLNEHIGERLVVTKLNQDLQAMNQRPQRELSQRYEKDSQTLYVARSHIKAWMERNHFNYDDLREYLAGRGILTSDRVKRTLGAGTDYTGGAVVCWAIKADHAELEGMVG